MKQIYYIYMIVQPILLFCCLQFAIQFTIQIDDDRKEILQNKIPEFIGLGYHLLQGNPFTNHVDEGFRAPIFDMTYQKQQKTQDQAYTIPDFTHSTQSVSCSLQSRVSSYTGTKNYQNQLQKIVKVDTRLAYSFIQASFTYSRTFSDFSNSTTKKNQTSTQSNAECTLYTINMPIYSNSIQLNDDFVEGVKQSMDQNNWENFVNHFGTHFASSVTFGGRYLLEHTYSQQSESLFKSMNIDTSYVAKIQFFNIASIELTKEMKKYQNQTQLVESRVEATRISTLGGLPPKSGDWIDWANTVKSNLAPVSYQLSTISILFHFIHNINTTAAISGFQSYLNNYCTRVLCPPLTPERPDPKPLKISFGKTDVMVGPAKGSNNYDTNDKKIQVGMRVQKILMGSKGTIDSIQFFLSDGISEHILPIVGNQNFNHQYVVPVGDQIKCVRAGITYGGDKWKFTSLQFTTRKGIDSTVFSGSNTVNEYQNLCVTDTNEHFVGFYGRYGATFESIGLNFMKESIDN